MDAHRFDRPNAGSFSRRISRPNRRRARAVESVERFQHPQSTERPGGPVPPAQWTGFQCLISVQTCSADVVTALADVNGRARYGQADWTLNRLEKFTRSLGGDGSTHPTSRKMVQSNDENRSEQWHLFKAQAAKRRHRRRKPVLGFSSEERFVHLLTLIHAIERN